MTNSRKALRVAMLTGAGANAYLDLPTLDEALDELLRLEDTREGMNILKEVRERTVKASKRNQVGANVEVIIGKLKRYAEIGEEIDGDTFLQKALRIRGAKGKEVTSLSYDALHKCFIAIS